MYSTQHTPIEKKNRPKELYVASSWNNGLEYPQKLNNITSSSNHSQMQSPLSNIEDFETQQKKKPAPMEKKKKEIVENLLGR